MPPFNTISRNGDWHGGRLDYSRYYQVTLCYHWQALSISFLLKMEIALTLRTQFQFDRSL